jgi:hypothetical protein
MASQTAVAQAALESLTELEALTSALDDSMVAYKEACKSHFDTIRKALEPQLALHDQGLDVLVVSPDDLSDEELRALGWTGKDLDNYMQTEVDMMYLYNGEQYQLLRTLKECRYTTEHNVTYRDKTWDTVLTVWH